MKTASCYRLHFSNELIFPFFFFLGHPVCCIFEDQHHGDPTAGFSYLTVFFIIDTSLVHTFNMSDMSYLWVVCGTSQICMSLFFKQTFTCELALVCVGTFFAPTSQAAMWQQDVRLSWLALKFTCDNSCCVGVLLCQKSDLWALYSEGFSTSMHRSWAEQHWSLSPRLQFQAALCAMPACTEVNDMCLSRFLYW